MAINLLPEEEKSKIKKEKEPASTHIELMGPGQLEKREPRDRRAGVLTFFKQAFVRPKVEPAAKPQPVMPKFPEKKFSNTTRFDYEKPAVKEKPKVAVFKPAKREPLLGTRRPGFFERMANFFSRLFGRKARSAVAGQPAVIQARQEQFPKYSPVKAEKISGDRTPKEKTTSVIGIRPTSGMPVASPVLPAEPAIRVPISPYVVPNPDAYPPLVPHADEKKSNRELQQIELMKPVPHPPTPVAKKSQQPSPTGPSWFRRLWQSIKSLFSRPPKRVQPPVFAVPTVPPLTKPVAPPAAAIEPIKLVPPAPKPAPVQTVTPTQVLPSKPKQPSKLALWFKHVWNSLTSLFARRRTVPPADAPARPVVKKVGTKPLDKFIYIEPVKKGSRVPPPPPPVAPPPPPPTPVKPVPAVAATESTSGVHFTEPTTEPPKPIGLDWEVNLMPEDALEVKVSLPKLMYLTLGVVIACGVVFGGWLWANWYYNTITTKVSKVNQDITSMDVQIRQSQQTVDQVQQLKLDIDKVQSVMDKHVYWSRVFTGLETYTVPEVYYMSMTADVNGTVSLSAIGKNYESAVKQLMLFEKATDFTSKVTVSGITFGSTTDGTTSGTSAATPSESQSVNPDGPVHFSISLSLLPTLFYFPK